MKEKLVNEMKASKEINQVGDESNKNWQLAFKLFTEATGVPVDMGCGGCWTKVRDWLLSD